MSEFMTFVCLCLLAAIIDVVVICLNVGIIFIIKKLNVEEHIASISLFLLNGSLLFGYIETYGGLSMVVMVILCVFVALMGAAILSFGELWKCA